MHSIQINSRVSNQLKCVILICNQDHAAVYALRGRRSTMEDRYVMIKIEPELGSGAATVLHAVLDGHGGEVMDLFFVV